MQGVSTNHFETEIEVNAFDQMLSALTKELCDARYAPYSLVIFGHGDKPRSFYQDLGTHPDIQLHWHGWSGPKWLKFLGFLASHAGILTLKNPSRLKEIYTSVGELSYCSLYLLKTAKAQQLISAVKTDHWPFEKERQIETLLESETDFFFLDTVFDHYSENFNEDVYYISFDFGAALPKSLKKIFKDLRSRLS